MCNINKMKAVIPGLILAWIGSHEKVVTQAQQLNKLADNVADLQHVTQGKWGNIKHRGVP